MNIPNELMIKEYGEAIQLLEDLKKKVEAGELMSILAVGELTSGDMYGACTSSQNVFAMAGYMFSWSMMRMGFVRDPSLLKDKSE